MTENINKCLQDLRFLFQQLTFKVILTDAASPVLSAIEKKLLSIPIGDWPEIRLQYLAELSKLKWDIDYLLREPNIRMNNGFLIGFRDRMKQRLFEGIDIINERRVVTRLFNEFIKGITYFGPAAAAAGTDPIYHRDGSCPPRDKPNLTCTSLLDPHIKDRVYTCYIERLIYDELWIQVMGSQQDLAHMEWLQNTHTAFQTCFPHTNVSVSIRMSNGKPDNVAIILENDSGTTTDLYEKAYYSVDDRYDTKITAIRVVDSITVAVKTNTFDKENEWTYVGGSSSGDGNSKTIISRSSVQKILIAIVKSRNSDHDISPLPVSLINPFHVLHCSC